MSCGMRPSSGVDHSNHTMLSILIPPTSCLVKAALWHMTEMFLQLDSFCVWEANSFWSGVPNIWRVLSQNHVDQHHLPRYCGFHTAEICKEHLGELVTCTRQLILSRKSFEMQTGARLLQSYGMPPFHHIYPYLQCICSNHISPEMLKFHLKKLFRTSLGVPADPPEEPRKPKPEIFFGCRDFPAKLSWVVPQDASRCFNSMHATSFCMFTGAMVNSLKNNKLDYIYIHVVFS